MATDERWYFTKEQLANTPSRRCGIDADKELSYRQQAANFIQDMGQRLMVTQLCINTAIVYMHRFYVFHSLSQFHRNAIAVASLFLAAKVEEQPRKLEHVIKMAYMCLHRDQLPPDSRSEQFLEQAQDLVFNENVLLQTLGFDVAIDHPHTHVVRCCQLVKASKDLAQTSYFMASNSLHLTTMCLQYKPTVVACFCIHLACKWSNWEIPQSNEGKHWFWYVDKTVTSELLQQLTAEFLHIFDKCPSRLKKKIMSISANQSPNMHHPSLPNSPFDTEPHKIQSPATSVDSGTVSSHSNRSHHTQEKQEKPEEKKVGATASSSRSTVHYQEYREKKERERLEREKAAAASATAAQAHIADPSKHHSHHHKPVSSASLSNKHQLSSVQKGAGLHHNHHHRPDMKVGQPVPQRHSTGVQPREPNRDPNRQRLPREYAGASSTSAQSHAPVAHQSRDANLDISDAAPHRTDITPAQDSASHSNTQEKPPSNNNYSVHRLNALDNKQAYDKRMHDQRHNKLVDHKKDGEQKAYGSKYLDPARIDRQRKLDTLEQRCEEVRKLIEKPVPLLPKTADVSYASKQTHHAKYNQPSDKLQSGAVSLTADMKHAAMMSQSALSQDKSPSAVASASASASAASQISQKTTSAKTAHSQHSVYGVSQILKDTIKNGSSQPCLTSMSNVDDPKSEKRPRMHDDPEKSSVDVQQSVPHQHTPPSSRHRSLFSPETPPTREPHAQRPKSKQKTPPSAARAMKQDRVSPFASPPASQQQDSLMMKRPFSEGIPSSHKRLRTASTSENEQPVKVKMEDASNLEAMKMLGRVPELIQSIRDTPSLSNCGRNSTSSIANADLKPPEQLTIKSLDTDSMASRFNTPMAQHKASSMNVQALANGLDPNIVVVKPELLEHHAKKDQPHRIPQAVCVKPEHPHPHLQQQKLEYSPMKTAQSISALLQEPLAPMPSLLQGVQQHTQMPQQPLQQEQLQQQRLVHHPLIDHQPSMVSQSLSMSSASDNVASIVSTVDMSALSCMPITHQQSSVESASTLTAVPTLTAVVSLEEKRSEHHKSEKKKKEKKHKHKDKEKSREKHKHKHKDKDKEKHREKDKEKSEETPAAAAPIKITIPKDKLNLGTETSPTVCAAGGAAALPDKIKSPQSTGLKIKIPKERLKAADSVSSSPAQPVMQGPLKIKIRTDLGISRTSTTSTSVSPSGTVSGSHASSESVNETSRKRDRVELTESAATINCPPLAKKQAHVPSTGYSQGHRPGERQNGRHYSSGSNNKVRGGGRGGRQHIGRGPPPLTTGPYAAANQRGGDGYHQRNSYGNQPRGQIPYPHQSFSASRIHGDVAYARGGRIGQIGQTHVDPYFFPNYPPQMYNPAGYAYDPAYYQRYQQYQQQQAYSAMYPAGNVIITPDGAIDTSVPPPSMLPNLHHQGHQSATSVQQDTQTSSSSLPPPPPPPPPAPPLPIEPPPRFTPPPPPPPEKDIRPAITKALTSCRSLNSSTQQRSMPSDKTRRMFLAVPEATCSPLKKIATIR